MVVTPAFYAKPHLRKSSNVFSVHIIKHGGFRLWQPSHHSHNEYYSHLNIVIKETFKGSNETKLRKTSCNDQRGCRWELWLLALPQHTDTHAHRRSEFVFHILSTGCVMTPVIKAGNCLEVLLRYWIQGQFSRRHRRQLDVKSLSSEIGSRAEQTHRRWYQRQEEMLALCCLTLVNGTLPTCYPIPPETLPDSVPSPNQTPGSPGDLIKTLHREIQASATSGAGARTLWTSEQTGLCSSSLSDPQQITSLQRNLEINSWTLLSLQEQGESRYSCRLHFVPLHTFSSLHFYFLFNTEAIAPIIYLPPAFTNAFNSTVCQICH